MLRSRALLAIAILCLCPAGWPSRGARADEASLEQIEEARQSYQTGTERFRAGRFVEAEAAFRRVHRALHSPGVLFDIALCQEKQRRWSEAADTYAGFLRESQRVAARAQLGQHIVQLRRRASRQSQLNAAAPPAGTVEAAASALPLPDEPALGTGEIAAAATSPAPGGGSPAAASGRPRWWVWLLVGGGAAAIAVGLGVGLSGGLQHGAPTPATWDVGPGVSSALVRF